MKDLKVNYLRNLKSNLLIFEPEEKFLIELKSKYAFELGMIEHNEIKGFLKPNIKRLNGRLELGYDISSLQPLSRVLEVRTMNTDEIKDFIIDIISATKALEEFLLEASSVVLDPEYIFTDLDLKKYSFLYIPRSENNKEEMKLLLESILDNINKEDKDCLITVYGMLKECQKRDFVINDLEELLEGNVQTEVKRYEPVVTYETETENPIECRDKKKKQFNIFGGIFKGNKAKEQTEEEEFLEKVFDGYEPSVSAACLNEEKSVFEVRDEEISNTVLLTDIKLNSSGRVLRSINGKEDIEISYLPFIIGKQDRICDYVLDVEGVSRIHLKFFENKGLLYAVDLNSRNGTYINGKKLENEENTKLNKGDIINICGMSYKLEM
nr:DUF6382 domain-containing protein [uncultured Lachnoanaerobaculum sp.]